ncbi:WecB/TagA/CpsF family glycosyltransferase [Rhodococcus sp. ARC_M12]|uniref:WecB/TagA/CpsF family glycosyltransferase n=1 Tax=Rhodococcus sp. ARC_M12 TaxID=2928854 RepID=UPI001FB272A1|nr:WecB/TagA/CpsF family glycosyltransferase [Rhodococcus sp. ARC_M12]MCJ0978358.1 WecB/TagA/CpsF family glycosyltransferase [Rhodococcus sp. ARC_M12]
MRLQDFSFVGVDGLLLCKIAGVDVRSSADLLVPRLVVSNPGWTILLVGGKARTVDVAARKLGSLSADLTIHVMDGYEGLLRGDSLRRYLVHRRFDLALIGLGPGLQEEFALELAGLVDDGIIATCGGFIDQYASGTYYPDWAYKYRLNWLVRLWKEPRRLWRRYTVDALKATVKRKYLARAICELPGFQAVYSNIKETSYFDDRGSR